MSVENAVKGLAVLTAIPVVIFAIWADYYAKILEDVAKENPHYDRAVELYKIRLAGLCAIFFQFGIFMGTAEVRQEAPIFSNLLFVAGILLQSTVQTQLERKVRKPSPELKPINSSNTGSNTNGNEPMQEMDLAMRAFLWATLGGAIYLGGFALPVVVVSLIATAFHASAPVFSALVVFAAIAGMVGGVAINFALGAFYLRKMLPTHEVGDGPLRAELEECFKKSGLQAPSLWIVESGRRREATAMMAGFASGQGLFKPGLFLSRGLLDALTQEEVRAVVLHEVSHLSLSHLRKRLAMSAALVVGTTAAATFCVFLTGIFIPGSDLQSIIGMSAAAAAFFVTFRQLSKQSRRHELDADYHSVRDLGAGLEDLCSALRKLDMINGKPGSSANALTLVGGSGHPVTELRIELLRLRCEQAGNAKTSADTVSTGEQKKAA